MIKIGFIGGGNMSMALIGGLIRQGVKPQNIHVIEPLEAQRSHLYQQWQVHTYASMHETVCQTDVLILAVKPQQMKQALTPLAGKIHQALVISIAAGLRLEDISRWLGHYQKLVRAMPNTPALIGRGVTGLFALPQVDEASRSMATQILSAVGKTVWVDTENLINAVTAVSGSGPAYVFRFIEALEAAGVSEGLSANVSHELAIQTLLGAAHLAAESAETPAVLRERVTSKGGTTAAALAVLDQHQFLNVMNQAIHAAAERGRELGDELGQENPAH